MFSRGALVLFALAVAEFFVFGLAARAVGATAVVLGSLAAAVFGMWLLRTQMSAMAQSAVNGGTTGRGDVPGRAITAIAGALLVIPGLITGLVGLLLLLPPIRALVRAKARTRLARLVPDGHSSPFDRSVFGPFTVFGGPARSSAGRDVVDVDIVSEDMPTSAPPELN